MCTACVYMHCVWFLYIMQLHCSVLCLQYVHACTVCISKVTLIWSCNTCVRTMWLLKRNHHYWVHCGLTPEMKGCLCYTHVISKNTHTVPAKLIRSGHLISMLWLLPNFCGSTVCVYVLCMCGQAYTLVHIHVHVHEGIHTLRTQLVWIQQSHWSDRGQ